VPAAPKNTLIIKASQSRWKQQLGGNVQFKELQGDHWSILQAPELAASISQFLLQ
jgi:thioesterase domain-containing protein